MTNTERITANNAELRECIEIAENLPERGSTAEVMLQNKTITENGTYSADSGYDGLGTVTVNVTGSGGSGGDYKTCTVRINSEIGDMMVYESFLTTVNDNQIQVYIGDLQNGVVIQDYVFENVLCGSGMYIDWHDGSGLSDIVCSGGIQSVTSRMFIAPTEENAVGIITIKESMWG